MSLTRKAPTAAKETNRPRREDLAQALAEREAELAEARRENTRLSDEVQARTRDLTEALQQQAATADVLKVISRSSALALPQVLQALIVSAVNLCADDGVIYLKRGDVFVAEADFEGDAAKISARNLTPRRPGRESVTGRVALSGQVEQIPDNLADPEFTVAPALRLKGIRSMLGVPLLRGGEIAGVFVLGRRDPGLFSDRAVEQARTFADQAVIAIENARLFDEVQAKTRDLEESLEQQTASAEILRVISSSPTDARPVFETIVRTARKLCDAERASVHILRDGAYHAIAVEGPPESVHDQRLVHHPIRPGRGSITGRVAEERSVVHIHDVKADPEFTYLREDGFEFRRTMLGVPLFRDGQVIGVIVLQRPIVQPFTKTHIHLVTTFADQAVIAIENARLFDEVQAKTRDLEESLQQQTATSNVLKVISRSAFDLDAVLKTLTESARSLSGAATATVFLRDGEVLRIRAESGVAPEFLEYLASHPIPPGRETGTGRVLMTGETVLVPDVLADPDYNYGAGPRLGNYRALLGVPLIRDGKIEGVFGLQGREPGAFTQRQIELVRTFADQAVIAIGNVRLFDEVQVKTRDLEESLQQQTATADVLKVISRSAFDLQAVLTTLAESARGLCGASFVTLFMRDDEEMRLRAESGCTPEIVAFLRAHPIRAGRDTFTGRVMLSGEAVHLPDVLADPEYDFGDAPRIGNYRALLGVPLLRDGQVEGVFALARPEPTPFSARQIEMVRAFADQAVIAIENSRLFEEVQARTRELAASLDDLRRAQDRLIQSEKLASLGQLTAGIAHEIKNPLNFINNYSALSRELIDELADATRGGEASEAARDEADQLIAAIGGNLDKIVQHGKRADSIVKNMLLHSREGSGERSTINVNAMVEEALNLAYHGARAEKPGFNVTIVKSLDPNAGAADVYAQEMTRVLLNLISNGFYATSKRKQGAADGAYEPTISASTRDLGPKVEIAIRDNGTGIPDEVKAKMFNPFFTTKPAGEGTGLGLSLSHDIVVKQHGGAIEVSTEPDAFTEFTIVLPRGAAGS